MNFTRHAFLSIALAIGLTVPVALRAEGPAETAEALDAVLVLDASGSMLLTDPGKLRSEGAKLFARFLQEGDRLGIVQFAEEAKIVRPLTAFDPKEIREVEADIDKVNPTGIYTDILTAVSKAKEMLELEFRDNANQVVILLSDGKFEPDPKLGSVESLTQKLMEQVIPEARGTGIKFYTLAFSPQADRELLKEIAAGTGGVSWYAENPDQIHSSYADLFLVVKKPQLVPLTKAGFQIDEDVKEATFYIKKEGNAGVSLIAPDGKIFSSETKEVFLKWFTGEQFDVITVRGPKPGSWQVTGIAAPEGYATLLTNLKLVTDWPTATSAGEKMLLQVRLYDAQKPVILPEMTGVVQYGYFITPTDRIAEPVAKGTLRDDGENGDITAGDGIFTAEVQISDVGDYKLRVVARAPTFERNQQMPFRVKPPFITLSMYHKEAESKALYALQKEHGRKGSAGKSPEGEDDLRAKDIIRAQLSEEAKGLKQISVNLIATDQHKQELIIPMKPLKADPLRFEVDEFGLPVPGKYELKAIVLATGQKGKAIQEMTAPFTYHRKLREGEDETKLMVVEEEDHEKRAPSPALPISFMTVLNLAAAVFAFTLIRKAQATAAVSMPDFSPISNFSPSLDALRARTEASEINYDDPKFASSAGVLPDASEIEAGEEEEPVKEAGEDSQASEEEAKQNLVSELDAELSQIFGETEAAPESSEPDEGGEGQV